MRYNRYTKIINHVFTKPEGTWYHCPNHHPYNWVTTEPNADTLRKLAVLELAVQSVNSTADWDLQELLVVPGVGTAVRSTPTGYDYIIE